MCYRRVRPILLILAFIMLVPLMNDISLSASQPHVNHVSETTIIDSALYNFYKVRYSILLEINS